MVASLTITDSCEESVTPKIRVTGSGGYWDEIDYGTRSWNTCYSCSGCTINCYDQDSIELIEQDIRWLLGIFPFSGCCTGTNGSDDWPGLPVEYWPPCGGQKSCMNTYKYGFCPAGGYQKCPHSACFYYRWRCS